MDVVVGEPLASRVAACAAITALASWIALFASSASCRDLGGGGQGGGGGAGGQGGASGCPTELAPLFTLRVQMHEGTLPVDLELLVSWSAGDEPTVLLGDDATYGTPKDNVVCARRSAGPTVGSGGGGGGGVTATSVTTGGDGGAAPSDELVCELWTSGPTRVRIDATGYVPFDDTLAPATADACERPVPSEVEVELVVEEPQDSSD